MSPSETSFYTSTATPLPVGGLTSGTMEAFGRAATLPAALRRERRDVEDSRPSGLLPRSVSVHGIPVSIFQDYDHVVSCIGERIAAGRKTLCVAINPEKIYGARRKPALRDILLSAHLHICDGVGAALAAKVLHGVNIPRITGVCLFGELTKAAPAKGWRIYLLGASPEANYGVRRHLEAKYPGIRIVGSRDGFFTDDKEVVADINASGADMLFVAMGSPRQEQWIIDNFDALEPSFMMGVGGTFDVYSGRVKRAPEFFCRTGTEWLYRLVSQPSRWRRQTILPRFALLTLVSKLTGAR